jgi:hypothetical protein
MEGCSKSVDGLDVVRWLEVTSNFPIFRWDPDFWREERGEGTWVYLIVDCVMGLGGYNILGEVRSIGQLELLNR